jgi:hypothetical protein
MLSWHAVCVSHGMLRKSRIVFGMSLTLALLAKSDNASSDEPAPLPACVRAWPEVRYRPYGYDHVVHIRNDCERTADCIVTTDVTLEPTDVSILPRSEVEVVTRVGSPSRVFTPMVTCRLP